MSDTVEMSMTYVLPWRLWIVVLMSYGNLHLILNKIFACALQALLCAYYTVCEIDLSSHTVHDMYIHTFMYTGSTVADKKYLHTQIS